MLYTCMDGTARYWPLKDGSHKCPLSLFPSLLLSLSPPLPPTSHPLSLLSHYPSLPLSLSPSLPPSLSPSHPPTLSLSHPLFHTGYFQRGELWSAAVSPVLLAAATLQAMLSSGPQAHWQCYSQAVQLLHYIHSECPQVGMEEEEYIEMVVDFKTKVSCNRHSFIQGWKLSSGGTPKVCALCMLQCTYNNVHTCSGKAELRPGLI